MRKESTRKIQGKNEVFMYHLFILSFPIFFLSACVVTEEPVHHHHHERVYVEPVAPVVVEEGRVHHRHPEVEVKVK
jgi:hypothetical protein